MTLANPAECPYYLISRVTLQATSAMKKGLAAAGVETVKPAYLGVLLSLWREDGLKVIELSRKAGLEPSTMTGLLDRMERDKLAYRQADRKDRRVQRIYLTSAGKDVEKPVLEVVEQVLAKMFAGVSETDVENAMNLMRQVLANAQEEGKQ